jgi:hypothetical protein
MPVFQNTNDQSITDLVSSAQERVFFLAPGVSLELARVLAARWRALGADRVQIVLDVDAEVCRLGYGTIEGLQHLQETAQSLGALVAHQAGARIGVAIADMRTVVWSPVPLLVADGDSDPDAVNAVWLDSVPPGVEREAGLSNAGIREQTVGLDSVPSDQVVAVEQDLERNPPQRFDVARVVRVFNAQFEFVELEMRGAAISRHTVPVPPDLMGLKDEHAQRLLRGSFKLIDSAGQLGDVRVMQLKRFITDRFLHALKGYGMVVRREDKPALLVAVDTLRRFVDRYQRRVLASLENEVARNRATIARALLPAVRQSIPRRWLKHVGPDPSDPELQRMLEWDLEEAFHKAGRLLRAMQVSLVFKAVTYESLNNPDFVALARRALPALPALHDEFDAARSEQHALPLMS